MRPAGACDHDTPYTYRTGACDAVRGAWGLSVRDDGRVAVTYAGQLVATTAYCTSEDQARVHTLYAALVRRGAR